MQSKLVTLWRAFRNNKPLFWSVILVLGWRVGLELLHIIAIVFMNPVPAVAPAPLNAYDWARWDGGWYLDIVNGGYRHANNPDGTENFAFFPMFPLLAKLFSTIFFIPPIYAALLLNTALTIGIGYFVYGISQCVVRQVGKNLDAQKIGILSVVSFLVYPSSLFFAAFYAEAILIFGITGAIYFALSRRLWMAVMLAALATASKSMGLVVLPVLAVIIFEQWRQDHKPVKALIKKWALVPFGLAGLVAFMGYLWIAFGQPLLFYTAVQAWGRNNTAFFLTEVWNRYYSHILQPDYFGWPYTYILMLLTLAVPFIVIGIGAWAALRFKMWWPLVLSVCAVALPLSSGVMESFNRYLMVCVALVPFVAIALSRKKWWVSAAWFTPQVLLLAYFTLAFLKSGKFAG